MARLYGAADLEGGGPGQTTVHYTSKLSKQHIYILLVASLAALGLLSNAVYSGVASNRFVLKYISGQCIGGCEVFGPPLSMSDSSKENTPKAHNAHYKAEFQTLAEIPFDQVVQLGEHTLGKPFRDYSAEEEGQPVMGKPYVDMPFAATIASTVPDNAARGWDFLDVDTEGGTLPVGY
uniref:Uncharacterized protein n=1 Tax=Cryptomonas curvata TaxID=233186 RepID=A0A7S0LYD4_9CRYP|mmetsp:Transcript_16269/g.34517  ORF Transcript_16269/g.34517 Transcript_16269/m.34517 type:complete len:178 (+) Transcript_16269:39-572(+)